MIGSGEKISLKNKHVALVGLAGYLEGQSHGKDIDAADIVIRVNANSPVDHTVQRDLGSRTDILFTSYNKDIRQALKLGDPAELSNIILCYPSHGSFVENYNDFCAKLDCGHAQTISLDSYLLLEKKLGGRPSSGLLAIDYLLQQDIKDLTLYGFSFFSTPHYPGFRKWRSQRQLLTAMQAHKTHKPGEEFNYVKRLFKQDDRLFADQTLQNLLEQEFPEQMDTDLSPWLAKILMLFR